MIGDTTPRFAKILSWKYSNLPSVQVEEDLAQNHLRIISRSHIQKVSYLVGEELLKQEIEYSHGIHKGLVKSVSIGRDGAMLPLTGGIYREAKAGTLSLVGEDRKVLHTIYLGDQPEYGKENFDDLMCNEIEILKREFGHLPWSAVADGSANNWTFFAKHTPIQIIDWWHSWEYIRPALGVIYEEPKKLQKQLEKWKETLQEKEESIRSLLKKFKKHARKLKKEQKHSEILQKAITYLSNHYHQMNYADYLKQGYLIGSGVTESACKTLIKSRFCGCGMQWEENNTRLLTLMRGLVLTPNRWSQAWKHLTKSVA